MVEVLIHLARARSATKHRTKPWFPSGDNEATPLMPSFLLVSQDHSPVKEGKKSAEDGHSVAYVTAGKP